MTRKRALASAKSSKREIPFNRPLVTGREDAYLAEVMAGGKFSGGSRFSTRCNTWLEETFGAARVLVATSGTHALEMAALLCDLEPGDEVILPSYAFPTTASAFVRCGARLVFVDIVPETMNLDPLAVERAVTAKTRVVVALHYGGVACDMRSLEAIAKRHGLLLVEDAAHAIFSSYAGRPCGALGDFGCFSFHESKNIHCGEGGALLVKDRRHAGRAEVIWEKGTDRVRFYRGETDKYTWRELGSSYVLSELNAAFLLSQLEQGEGVTADRRRSWQAYHRRLAPLAEDGRIEVACVPQECAHNGHLFWLKTRSSEERDRLIPHLKGHGIHSVFHYVPLHTSPAGRRFGRFAGEDRHTTRDASRLLRLPLFFGFDDVDRVADALKAFYCDGTSLAVR